MAFHTFKERITTMVHGVTMAWITSDGKSFNSEGDANRHQATIDTKAETRFNNWATSTSGKKMLEKYSWTTYGIWNIRGEDPNCDLGGAHYQPDLGTVKGTLGDAVRYAVGLSDFYTWGRGGDITKVEIKEL
jgi:hypothetical protein